MTYKKWDNDLNLKFLEAYKAQECLWNQFHSLYKNKSARETALIALSEEMQLANFGIHEVKAKIKSFRSTYNLELDKQKKSELLGNGPEDVYVPSLKWFNLMQEIMTKGTLQRPRQNILHTLDQQADSYECELDPCAIIKSEEPNGFGEILPQLPEDDAQDSQHDFSQSGEAPQPPMKKFKPDARINQISSTLRQIQKLSNSFNFKSEENEWDIFGNLVAARLKKLNPQRAIEAELRINAVLNEFRQQELIEQTQIS